jgi:hypothetical protein
MMHPDINATISSNPNANEAVQRRSGSVFPLFIPRLPQDLFPITSQDDLVAKLTAVLSPRSAPASFHGEALPAGNPAPAAYDAVDRK